MAYKQKGGRTQSQETTNINDRGGERVQPKARLTTKRTRGSAEKRVWSNGGEQHLLWKETHTRGKQEQVAVVNNLEIIQSTNYVSLKSFIFILSYFGFQIVGLCIAQASLEFTVSEDVLESLIVPSISAFLALRWQDCASTPGLFCLYFCV